MTAKQWLIKSKQRIVVLFLDLLHFLIGYNLHSKNVMSYDMIEQTYTHTYRKQEALEDYRIAQESRQISLVARSEVFMGKAKFGILGDGKELPQVAMARVFQPGDFRSGYYRDQTFMMAAGLLQAEHFFAQLYAHSDIKYEPSGGGRLMTAHFSSPFLDSYGNWLPLTQLKNSTCDISPTGSQMPRLLGLALASKLFRNNPELHNLRQFSVQGNEVAFGTIGNASCAEGMFWETINAAAVMQVPMLVSIWDDGYGISVPNSKQIAKDSIYEALLGFQRTQEKEGIELLQVKGWDYEALRQTYQYAAELCRTQHVPVVIHVTELTQPQGHSTSGSHERYKTAERLQWEKEHDGLLKMKEWLLQNAYATPEELAQIEQEAKNKIKIARNNAWKEFLNSIKKDHQEAIALLQESVPFVTSFKTELSKLLEELIANPYPIRKDATDAVRKAVRFVANNSAEQRNKLLSWVKRNLNENYERYSSHLHSESEHSPLLVKEVKPIFHFESSLVDGREVVKACFDALLEKYPTFCAFGEDVGRIGDVNQGFAGLQEKYSDLRVFDTGIRECTIIGQAIGMAMRGMRPLVEIQYLDYLLYAIQILSDDVATLHYRTKGQQKAPLIVRTRGHRLEGVWHAGSPIGMIINSLRGMWLCVPRNMTQAAGMYNTLMDGDDPALVIECLNGYRLKERMPANISEMRVPLGLPEVLCEGTDITIVTYGSMCRIVEDAVYKLEKYNISCELIDAQTLLPFDRHQVISQSLKKTNKLIVADEDVPGGASAYILQQIIEVQKGYQYLDAAPITITAKPHRPAYATDGDYFSKPSSEDIFQAAYNMMHEYNPDLYPNIYL